MQPLSPKDLLIRTEAGDNADTDGASAKDPVSPVKLERFQILEHTIRDTPLTAEPYLELAGIYMQASRWTDARRILDLAFTRFSDIEEVCYLREEAQLARSLELFDEVKREYEAEPTELTKASFERSTVELNVLREGVYRARIARHPDQTELNIPLAAALENLGKVEHGLECLMEAYQVPKLRAEASLELGRMLERAKRIPEALSAYRRAATFRVPPPPEEIRLQALTAAADLAESSGLIDSARRYVRVLSELQPNEAEHARRLEELKNTPL